MPGSIRSVLLSQCRLPYREVGLQVNLAFSYRLTSKLLCVCGSILAQAHPDAHSTYSMRGKAPPPVFLSSFDMVWRHSKRG